MGLLLKAALIVDSEWRAGYSVPNDSRPAGYHNGSVLSGRISRPKISKNDGRREASCGTCANGANCGTGSVSRESPSLRSHKGKCAAAPFRMTKRFRIKGGKRQRLK